MQYTVSVETPIEGDVIAQNVSFDDFIDNLEWEGVEWVYGLVVKMPGIDERHDSITGLLRIILTIYLEIIGGGRVLQDPMLLRARTDLPVRVPDLQALLANNLNILKKKLVAGVPNLVIEVISEGSARTDRITKFEEYEKAGIPEYWVLDHEYHEAMFFQLDSEGKYTRVKPDENGFYHSKALSGLKLPVDWLWRVPPPPFTEIVTFLQDTLKQE